MLKKFLLIFTIIIASALLLLPSYYLSANTGQVIDPTNDIWDSKFMIDVNKLFPWVEAPTTDTKGTIDKVLEITIQNLVRLLAIISVFIMIIWAWYMILHNWQEDLLSRWKWIFMAWIIAMVVALASYIIISVVRYLLYATSIL